MTDEQTTAQSQSAVPEKTEQASVSTRTWTEAPYSGNVRARIGGYDWQLTIRDDDRDHFVVRVLGLNKWLDAQHANGNGNGNGHTQSTVTQAQSASSVPVATVAPIQSTVPATSAQPAQVIDLHISKMEITPRSDGRVDVKFYAPDHKYPDIYTTNDKAVIAAQLAKATGANWKPEHFRAAQAFNLNLVIGYTLSDKLNKNGKPYKNIQSIKAA